MLGRIINGMLAALVLCLPLTAQQPTLRRTYDSLDAVVQQRLAKGLRDRTTVELLNRMSYYGSVRDVHLLNQCGEQALKIAKEIGDRAGEGRARSAMAAYRILEYGLDSLAQKMADTASMMCQRYGTVDDKIAGLLLKQQVYDQLAQHFEASRVVDSACMLAKDASFIEIRVNAHVFAAWTYMQLQHTERVREHVDAFLAMLTQTNSAELHAMAAFTANATHYDETKRAEFFATAWEIDSVFDLKLNRVSLYTNRAYTFLGMGDNEQALQNALQAVALAEQLRSRGQMLWAYGLASQCYLALQRYADAERTALYSLQLAKEQQHRDLTVAATSVLGRTYEALGKYQLASRYFDTLSTLLSASIDPQIGLRFAAYQVETVERQKAAEIARIEEERKNVAFARNVLIGGAAFATLSAIGLLVLFRRARRARHEADRLLLNVLPPTIATRLKAGETTIADHFDHVSIMFLDIANFSRMASNTSPSEIVHLLNDAFTICDGIITKYGLEKIKTIGDAYMAVCGAPTPNADHVRLTALAALEIRDAIKNVSIRIGIHTGPAVGGIIGERKFSYDLWGDTVNIASRMESTGEVGRIQVSESFASLLTSPPNPLSSLRGGTDQIPRVIPSVSEERGTWHLVLRGETEIKGKGVMTTYWLERA